MVNRKLVAEKAGVSVATVSRVLNSSGYVSERNRSAVLKVASELGYLPNPVARSLKMNRTRQILFNIRDLSNNYYMEMYKGMLDYAGKNGYVVIIGGNYSFDQIGGMMVDGVIFSNEFSSDSQFTGKLHIPTVVASYGIKPEDDIEHIDVDTYKAMVSGILYLFSKGHTKIAYSSFCKGTSDPRSRAYSDMLRPVLGNKLDSYILGPAFNQTTNEINYYENGIIAAKGYLENKPDATAIICFNDDTAIGLMCHLQSNSVKIPDDVSVLGIDGHFGGVYTSPPLTTVSISPHAHGIECARKIIGLVEGDIKEETGPVEIKLIERSSVRRI